MAYKVFISHSSVDTWVARQIERCVREVGADTFLDNYDIDVGDKFAAKINAAINDSHELLVLFTARALESDWVTFELGMAFNQDLRICPILYDVDRNKLRSKPSVDERTFVDINDLDVYFSQLKNRVQQQ